MCRPASSIRPRSTSGRSPIGSTPAGMPDPDLLIRTAGEMRVSNFLLWQISYAEIWVTDQCWPEFREADCTRRSAISPPAIGASAGWEHRETADER